MRRLVNLPSEMCEVYMIEGYQLGFCLAKPVFFWITTDRLGELL